MFITEDIKYVGVNDHAIDLFEGQYVVPNGMAYNSYVITDEKTAVMDSVEIGFADEWIEKVKAAVGGKGVDYLVVQHMEPDHSSSIMEFAKAFPDVTIVSSAKAFAMMKNFFGTDFDGRKMVVGEGDTLSLGKHTLSFITAPMVHWPEVVMTYDSTDKVLFSADAFGKFGALDVEEDWVEEARRYYIGIVGKYGVQVQNVLKKAASLDIEKICALHGPVLSENLGYYLDLYNTWSGYKPETKGVMIAYTSIYGNTKKAALLLAEKLAAKGETVQLTDLARSDVYKAVSDAFRYDRLVLASTTYNMDVFPAMREYIEHLTARNFGGRTVAFIENGSWAPVAAKVMKGMLEKSKDITYAETAVKILSAVDDENLAQLDALADELAGGKAESEEKSAVKRFVCDVCGYVYEGDEIPDDYECPLCGVGKDMFSEM